MEIKLLGWFVLIVLAVVSAVASYLFIPISFYVGAVLYISICTIVGITYYYLFPDI